MQSGARRDEIVEALRDAFPDPGDMEIVVGLPGIGTNFKDYRTAVGTTYRKALNALISNYTAPHHQLLVLLEVARQKNTKTDKLRAVMDKLTDLEDRFRALRPDKSFGEAEQIVLRGVTFEDIGVQIENLKVRRRAVCRLKHSEEKYNSYFHQFICLKCPLFPRVRVAGIARRYLHPDSTALLSCLSGC